MNTIDILIYIMAEFMIFIILVIVPINLIGEQQRLDNACQEIGYNRFVRMNNGYFCTNDNINLFSVKLEEKGLLPAKYKVTKINLYNYGEIK